MVVPNRTCVYRQFN